jgi:UDP-3-O-[3-hydroxymyristoyl] glucosamine N-acyltransferase
MFSLKEVADIIDGRVVSDNTDKVVNKVIPFELAGKDDDAISWVSDKNLSKLKTISKGVYIVSEKVDQSNVGEKSFIIVREPRYAFSKIMKVIFKQESLAKIEVTAIIDKNANISNNVYIGCNVVIEKNCKIGSGTRIGHNTVILENTIIGNNVIIGCNCTIGGTGFGYVKNEDGYYTLIPHAGIVEIEDNVEIGNNVAIDRAVLGKTIIQYNTKIDNLVHIAHGVSIGENSIITANSTISGSCQIGSNTWLGPSSVILNKIDVEANAQIGIGAVVVRDIKANDKVFGNPARSTKGC